MAQDPESGERPNDEGAIDPSPDFDLVTIYSSSGIYAEMEASNIHGMLEAAGMESVVIGDPVLPLQFDVRVPRMRVEEANRLLEEAREAGPSAASEAEAASE